MICPQIRTTTTATTRARRAGDGGSRRLLVGLALVLAVAVGTAGAQVAADRTTRIVVSLAAGSGNDLSTRVLADGLQAELGHAVIVDNRPGADGAIAVRQVASASPDGSTLLSGLGSIVAINPALRNDLPYDPKRDLVPVAMVARQPLLLIVAPTVPATTLREFVEYARRQRGAVNYGAGTNTFMLAGELFKQVAGVEMQHIPFNGSGPVVTAVMAGTVQAAFITAAAVIGPAKSGKLRVLAVTGSERLAQLPDVPTFSEEGITGLDIPVWSAIYAPAGTPREVVDRLNAAIRRALSTPSVRDRLTANAETIVGSSPEALAATAERDAAKMKELVTRIGLAPR